MGWFPQEPCSIGIGAKEDNKNEHLPLVVSSGYNLSATLIAGLTAVFYVILGSLLIVPFLNLEKSVALLFQGAWIIAGLTAGALSGTIAIKNQLRRLSKNQSLSTNKQDLFILLFPLLVLFIIGQFMSINYVALRSLALLGDLSAVFAFAVIVQIIRYGLFYAYEKKKKVWLLQSSLRGRIIVSKEMRLCEKSALTCLVCR